jgi:hypothetical protein
MTDEPPRAPTVQSAQRSWGALPSDPCCATKDMDFIEQAHARETGENLAGPLDKKKLDHRRRPNSPRSGAASYRRFVLE